PSTMEHARGRRWLLTHMAGRPSRYPVRTRSPSTSTAWLGGSPHASVGREPGDRGGERVGRRGAVPDDEGGRPVRLTRTEAAQALQREPAPGRAGHRGVLVA